MTTKDLNPKNYEPLIISVALTGAIPSKAKYAALPTEPEEIAAQASQVAEQGASIVHIHMRDEDGQPVQDILRFAETIGLIRREKPELIICATTTARGSSSVEDRMAPLYLEKELLPDMASLTLGSYNTPSGVNLNPPDHIEAISHQMAAVDVLPEVEIFEPGMIETAYRLQDAGILSGNVFWNILLGVAGASPARAGTLTHMVELLPSGAPWAAAGIGHFQKTVNATAVAIGGHVRVGLEDDPRGDHDGWTNVEAVLRARKIADAIGRSIMDPSEVRSRLGLSTDRRADQ